MKVLFTSDWHFGHENIITYCKRPFQNVEEMNNKIIKSYNQYVNKGDVVYFLGDVGFSRSGCLKKCVGQLKHGTKILVIGNHDKQGREAYVQMGFAAVVDYAEIKLGKHTLSLSHYPKRNYVELFRLFKLYYRKMRTKQRTLKQVWQRLKRELSFHRRPSKNWHICGHVHDAWKTLGKNINVGVDVWEFRPVSAKEILRIISKS